MIYDVGLTHYHKFDMRESMSTTWRDVVASVLEDCGDMELKEIYSKIEGHKKCQNNVHWKEKVRQVLQCYSEFTSPKRGVWKVA